LLIEDNLSIHVSREVKLALAAWPNIQVLFIPKYACWLNLIEPWWKQCVPWHSRENVLRTWTNSRWLEPGFGILECSSSSLYLEEEASTTGDFTRRVTALAKNAIT